MVKDLFALLILLFLVCVGWFILLPSIAKKSVQQQVVHPQKKQVVHPKSDKQRRRLQERVKMQLLFRMLDQEQLNEVSWWYNI